MAKINYFSSWSDLVEVIMFTGCLDFYGDTIKSRILLEIIFEILQKVFQ